MKIFQQQLQLQEKRRGFHLVTEEILRQLQQIREIKKGICHVFIQHTSASLIINENADPTVRKDLKPGSIMQCRKKPIIRTTLRAMMTCLRI